MKTSAICDDDERRDAVRRKTGMNGLDYLDVDTRPPTLTVFFLGKAPAQLLKGVGEDAAAYKQRLRRSVRIEGGRRVRDIGVVGVEVQQARDSRTRKVDPLADDRMIVRLDKYGDFSIYTLRLVGVENIDPFYDHIDFTFKVDCPSDLDCAPADTCPPPTLVQPEINYLAKDYASFRQLILDRLALIMPGWKERHVPDIGIALVELLAYAGDYLSYYQDAVATEAYLDTARQRISVRRHARLVDYRMHEGCNARAWVCVETDTDLTGAQALHPRQIFFVTGYNDALALSAAGLTADVLQQVSADQYEVFEPITTQLIQLYAAHNKICFYTWGHRECCLPRGATSATLRETCTPAQQPSDPASAASQQRSKEAERTLNLARGDVLIFEEIIGPHTGNLADADPTRRHTVRLTSVTQGEDVLYDPPVPIVEIEWAAEDALPFTLCISAISDASNDCKYIEDISVARGNIVLVDHGRTLDPEDLGVVLCASTQVDCDCADHPGDISFVPGRYQPKLGWAPLTFRQELPPDDPSKHQIVAARRLIAQDVRAALPQIVELKSVSAGLPQAWSAQTDLLSSQPDDWHFVVEVDNDGHGNLRFGDGALGRQPAAGSSFVARYRVGNGARGNVGPEAISHLVFRDESQSDLYLRVRNPLPSQGGTEPEPIAEVKLFAPFAFRKDLQRAITADDYAQLVQRQFKDSVQQAAATLSWTGSWYEARVSVDPFGAEEVGQSLLDDIEHQLEPYRRIGHDLNVTPAQYVSLDVEITVCVLPHYLRGHVEAVLLDVFSNRVLPNGKRGFFHPDNLMFGGGIYLSQLVAAAQAVTGVESVTITRLQRLYAGDNGELDNGVLPLGPLEVARLDNDPDFPEHSRLMLNVRGGR